MSFMAKLGTYWMCSILIPWLIAMLHPNMLNTGSSFVSSLMLQFYMNEPSAPHRSQWWQICEKTTRSNSVFSARISGNVNIYQNDCTCTVWSIHLRHEVISCVCSWLNFSHQFARQEWLTEVIGKFAEIRSQWNKLLLKVYNTVELHSCKLPTSWLFSPLLISLRLKCNCRGEICRSV